MSHHRTLLVTGASGHLGRAAVEYLLAAGETHIVATTRTPEKLADLAARGVDVRKADFEDEGGLVKAFAGAERLLLISTDSLAPGVRQAQHLRALSAAKKAGVKHIVYTSLTHPGEDSPIPLAADHRITEKALADSEFSYTVLRNNMYMDTLLGTLPPAFAHGALVNAANDGAIGLVTRDDCAAAAASALRSDASDRTVLDITGPEALPFSAIAAIASDVAGRPLAYVPASEEAVRDGMISAGLPPFAADLYLTFDRATSLGHLAVATDTVERLTGRPATSVRTFLQENPIG